MSLRDEVEEMIREAAPQFSPGSSEAVDGDTGEVLATLKVYCDALRDASLRLAEELDVLMATVRR
jgi:hypothetical protein